MQIKEIVVELEEKVMRKKKPFFYYKGILKYNLFLL